MNLIHAALGCATLLAWPAGAAVDFERDVRPVLGERCVECHGEKKQKAELRLDAKHFAFKGGENGAVIVPGDAAKSPLFQRITTTDEDERMPPKGDALSKAQVEAIKSWINDGAVWPESDADKAAVVDKRLEHWAFQPVRVEDAETRRRGVAEMRSVDFFIRAKLAEQKLALSKPADKRTLIRRVYFDVIGLPPSPEEIEAFAADKDPKAYEKLVDRLLASPRFGERWARHWLDVVRFAESDGFETNRERKNAWPYRDYVIRAFNEDKPYDQFVREQLAGDALGEDAATGFLVGGAVDRVKSPDPVLTKNQRADELHDIVSTTGASFIGLTINCARCHDHKFDPILMKDYYAMTALLQGVQHGERALRTGDTAENQKQVAALRKRLAPLEEKLVKFQPLARRGRVVLVDDAAEPSTTNRAGVTQIEQPKNGMPVEYSPGRERGQADDPGDVQRLPNLGGTYRYWDSQDADLFTWDPRVEGDHRIWISWAVWTTHTKDAVYVLDRDGNVSTTNDQSVIARVDQSRFPDSDGVADGQKRWSGFKLAGTHQLSAQSVVVLRTGEKGGPHTADVLAFEEVVEGEATGAQPALRAPVQHSVNEERFAEATAKFLRFTVTACSTIEPCIDELEVFDAKGANIALAKNGTKATASGTYPNNPKHKLEHINDGKFGNDFSWISNTRGSGWVQLEFAKPQTFGRVTWSRDRRTGKAYEDRLALGYRIEVSGDGTNWQFVASSADRPADAFRTRVATIPTLVGVAAEEAKTAGTLLKERGELLTKIAELSKSQMGYVGTFQQPGPTFRNHRGDPMQPKEAVLPATLSLIGKKIELADGAQEQERRQALAGWITDPANPLTARVIVNRLWHYHFGTGLVDTPSDFGINGGRPSHPELLDWLAAELVANKWSLKHIHRLILLSETYRQSSAMNEKAFAKDSSARLLWRFPPRRMEAEALRDTMLAVSGRLDLKMGGPGFDLFEPNENYVKVYKTKSGYGPAEFRRMVYQSKPRTMLDDFFGAFDCPDAGQPAPKRTASTTPLQALNLLNSNFAIQQANYFAERLKAEAGDAADAQIKRAYQLAFGRAPSSKEASASRRLIEQHGLPIFCRALFNANEFVRVE